MKIARKCTIIATLIAVMLVTISTSAYAWCGSMYNPYGNKNDVHYQDTEKWSVEKGIDKFWAKQVAIGCDSVDVIYKFDYKWHLNRQKFTGDNKDTRLIQSENQFLKAKKKLDEVSKYTLSYEKAKSKFEKTVLFARMTKSKEEALLALGMSLHPLQDIYAHMDAGMDTPDNKIGTSHGMLEAPEVDVKVYYSDGNFEVRKMKLETTDKYSRNYSLYDDTNYDYVDGQWIFKQDMKKEENSRWIKTREASYVIINEFLAYAQSVGIKFDNKPVTEGKF